MMNVKLAVAGVVAVVVAFGGGIVVQKRLSAPQEEVNPFGLPMLTAEQQKAEDAFLRIDLDGSARRAEAQIAASGEKPLTENVPYRRCTKVPEVADPSFDAGTAEASARRRIYSIARFNRVLATKDCTCAGKVAPWSVVVEREAALRAEFGDKWTDQWPALQDEATNKRKLVEALCGGEF